MKKYLVIVMLLAAAMVIFAACSSDDDGGGANQPQVVTPAQTPTPTAAPANVEPPSEEELEVDFLAMDPIELTIHYIFAGQVWQDDWRVWQQVTEHTGVTLTGVVDPVNTNVIQQFEIAATEGFPAHIYGGTLAAQFRQYGMEGAFIPLNDLIEEHAPYFSHLMERFPEIRAGITAPDGNIYHMPNLNDVFDDFAASEVYWIRQDWLDLLGLEVPDTIEELEYVLTRFRDDMPALTGNDWVAPFFTNSWQGGLRSLTTFWGARTFGNEAGIRLGPRLDDSNTIVHYWIQPEFMTAIENISRWFQDGLIDPEFFSRGGLNRQELFGSNQGGFLQHFPMSTGDFNPLMREEFPDFNLLPIIPPRNVNGDRLSCIQRPPMSGNGWAISHNNPDPVRTVQLMDWFYHGIGRLLLNFGPQGITWEFDEEGEPRFLDYVREQGTTVLEVIRTQNGGVGAFPYMADLRYELRAGTAYTTMAQEMYANPVGYPRGFAPLQMPVMVLPVDDQLIVSEINANLNAFMNETIQSFILNDWTEIAGQWDAYVQQAISLGAQELEEIYQQLYDRFRSGN